MIKAFTLLFIGVFVGVGLGALERFHGRRLWQKKTNKGCEWRRVVEAWQTCRIQAVEKQSRLPGWFPLGAWDGAPLLPSFIVFTTGAPSPSIYTQTQRNARMGINPQNVFLLELQIWASSAELFKCKCNEMSWVTPEEKQVLLNQLYSFLSHCLLDFCQVTCVKWFYVLVVHWHIWSFWCCSLMSVALFFCFFSCKLHWFAVASTAVVLMAPLCFAWTSPHLFFFLSRTPYDTLWHAPSHLFSSQLLF